MTEPMPRSILPMQLQIGDRFTDEEGEWEVTHRPFARWITCPVSLAKTFLRYA